MTRDRLRVYPRRVPVDLTRVSRNCAEGRHHRCLGTVYVHPPVDGTHLAECACPRRGCGHGTEVEKARRRLTLHLRDDDQAAVG